MAGTARLTRLAARRDRLVLPIWVLSLTAFLAATTAMFVNSLRTHADVVQETQIPTNNAGLRLLGLTSGPSVGGATMVRDYVLLALLAAMMSVLAVVRHTSQDEELGRAEVVGSTVVGRHAALAAAVIVTLVANVALFALLGLAMVANGQPASGAFTAGAAVAAVGVVFTGVAAVAAQLASTTRATIGVASAVLGVAFLLSGVGNMLGTADPAALRVISAWPAWLSPIGWGQQMRPFGGNHWWPLALVVVLTTGLLVLAVALGARRDVGAGLWPERRGRANAARGLLSPAGLAFRLQRGGLVGWAVGLIGFGLIFGAMSRQIQDVHGSAREWYVRVGGTHRILLAYDASMVGFAGTLVALYVVQQLLRMRVDEAGGTLESLLATGVTRAGWVRGHVLNAVGGALVLMLAFALSMSLTASAVLGAPPTQVRRLLLAGLVQVPAILVVGGAVVAVVGLLPKIATPIAWGLLLAAMLFGPMFGPALSLPQRVLDLSPFTHLPKVPATEVTSTPLLLLTSLGVTLGVLGVAAVRRRDLALPA